MHKHEATHLPLGSILSSKCSPIGALSQPDEMLSLEKCWVQVVSPLLSASLLATCYQIILPGEEHAHTNETEARQDQLPGLCP